MHWKRSLFCLTLLFCVQSIHTIEIYSIDGRAKSAPSVPTLKSTSANVKLQETEAEKVLNNGLRRWQAYEAAFDAHQYERALYILDHSRQFKDGAPIYKDLPYYYNRAALNLILYFETGKRDHLQHARLDFGSAIKACPHFYFAYLGDAQVAFLLRDYKRAYEHIRNLIVIFETAHQNGIDTLLISTSDFKGVLYLADLYINGGLALFRLGSQPTHIDEHYDYALKLLNDANLEESYKPFAHNKRLQYYNTRHSQLQTQQLIGFNIYSRFERFSTSYDGGPFEWLSLANSLKKYSNLFQMKIIGPADDDKVEIIRKPMRHEQVLNLPPPPPPPPAAALASAPAPIVHTMHPPRKKSSFRDRLKGFFKRTKDSHA